MHCAKKKNIVQINCLMVCHEPNIIKEMYKRRLNVTHTDLTYVGGAYVGGAYGPKRNASLDNMCWLFLLVEVRKAQHANRHN